MEIMSWSIATNQNGQEAQMSHAETARDAVCHFKGIKLIL